MTRVHHASTPTPEPPHRRHILSITLATELKRPKINKNHGHFFAKPKRQQCVFSCTEHGDGQQAHSSTEVTAADLNAKVEAAVKKVGSDWNDLPEGHALLKMSAKLGDLIQEAGYAEMYGVELAAPTDEYVLFGPRTPQSNKTEQRTD